MPSQRLFMFCFILICSILICSSIPLNTGRVLSSRPRKLTQASWLSAPHLPALSKRGRFVFREAPFDHLDESIDDAFDFFKEKRNWRL